MKGWAPSRSVPPSLGGNLRKPPLLPTGPQAPAPLSHPWHWLSRRGWLQPDTRLWVSTPVPADTLGKDRGPQPHPPKSHLRLTSSQAPHPSGLPHSTPGPRALCLLPCLDKDIKFNVTRDCGASARPPLVTPQPPLPGEEGRLPSGHLQPWSHPGCCPTWHPPPRVSATTCRTPPL